MPYYIQTRKSGQKVWKTRKTWVYATLKDALSALENFSACTVDECRIAESYVVPMVRYKPVKVK